MAKLMSDPTAARSISPAGEPSRPRKAVRARKSSPIWRGCRAGTTVTPMSGCWRSTRCVIIVPSRA